MPQIFDIVITLLTPFNTTDASSNNNNGKTMRKPYFDRDKVKYWEVGIGANNIKGRVRREITNILHGAIAEQGYSVSIAASRGLFNAKATGVPSPNGSDIPLIQRCLNDPFVGLLGGGKYMLASNFALSEVNAITERNIGSLVVPKFLAHMQTPINQKLTYFTTLVNRDSHIHHNYENASLAVENYQEKVAQWEKQVKLNNMTRSDSDDNPLSKSERNEIAELQEQYRATQIEEMRQSLLLSLPLTIAQEYEAKGKSIDQATLKTKVDKELERRLKNLEADLKNAQSKKLGVDNLINYELVVPGTSFHFRVTNKDYELTDAQIGLLIKGLINLFQRRHLGNQSSLGHGKFTLTIFNKSKDTIVSYNEDFEMHDLKREAETYVAAADDFLLSQINLEYLELLETVYGC